MFHKTAALILAAAAANAHFVLKAPTGLGFKEDVASQGPCGSFDVNNRTTVTDWPVNGAPVSLLNADDKLTATFKFALASNTATFTPGMKMDVAGKGNLCLLSVPAPDASNALVGKDGVLQIAGQSSEGQFFQCAAIRFTAPVTTHAAPAGCQNSTGVMVTIAQ